MTKINYDVTLAPEDNIVAEMNEIIQSGHIKDSNLEAVLLSRFSYIVENNGKCKMNNNDDKLISFGIKYFNRNSMVWGNAFLAAELKIRPLIIGMIKALKVEKKEDWEDYFSDARKVILQKIEDYEPEKALLVTYLSRYIKHEFYTSRNTASRYYSTRIKLAVKAMDALKAADRPINNKTIAEYINTFMPLSRDITEREIENALKFYVSVGEINENITASDEMKNPEAIFIEQEYAEGLRHACDSENWAIKAMFDIYKEYYLEEKHESDNIKKNLSIHYLKQEMFKKTGMDFSDDRIKSIIYSMSNALKRYGYGHQAEESIKDNGKAKISTFIVDSTDIDALIADAVATGNQ